MERYLNLKLYSDIDNIHIYGYLYDDEYNQGKNKADVAIIALWTLFAIYAFILLRIVLFKNAPLYDLFSCFGENERIISLIPFASVADMFTKNAWFAIVTTNVLGNIALFVPFGILLPALFKTSTKQTILMGAGLSLSFEVIQLITASGICDIDDLIFNTLGVILGTMIYSKITKMLKDKERSTIAITKTVVVMGILGCSAIFMVAPSLFFIFP